MKTSLREILELRNFGDMITSTTYLESRDKNFVSDVMDRNY